jgi:hypothetical protein
MRMTHEETDDEFKEKSTSHTESSDKFYQFVAFAFFVTHNNRMHKQMQLWLTEENVQHIVVSNIEWIYFSVQ